MRCQALTKGGGRCKLDATTGSFCWSHDPENAEERKRRGRRGGKARGASELSEIKRDVRKVIDDVLAGTVLQGPGAVALQGYNTLLRAAKVELDIREQTELIERLEALERAASEAGQKGGRWGA
ncbi:MAG: hypothetical protein H0T57_03195 [Rubrobacter sp.]|nr:hypothetical protein [Rubrobacter sp.]